MTICSWDRIEKQNFELGARLKRKSNGNGKGKWRKVKLLLLPRTMWHDDKCLGYPFYPSTLLALPDSPRCPRSLRFFCGGSTLWLLLLLLAMANDQSRCRNRVREAGREWENECERDTAFQIQSRRAQKAEGIDRNYAIKIKQCGVIFMVRFSMSSDTETHSHSEDRERERDRRCGCRAKAGWQ